MSKKSAQGKKKGATAGATHGSTYQVTSEAALDFIRKMQKAFPKAPRTKKDKERLRKYLAQFRDRLLKAVGRRVQSDLMLRPPQTIRRRDFKKPRSSGYVSRDKQV